MKLHDFILQQQSGEVQKLRDLGKALVQPSPLRVSEVAKKPAAPMVDDLDLDGDTDGMDAAVASITDDHKTVKNKIRNYD